MKSFFAILGIIFIPAAGMYGQSVSSVRAMMDGENVKIVFDLISPNNSDRYEISLFCSYDNFKNPLTAVSGSIGKNVRPGSGLVILWNAREELVNFKGDLVFEVRGTVMGGYYTVTNPSALSRYKRGKLLPINWRGGEGTEKIKIELIKTNQPVATISENVSNQGSYIWTIPPKIKPSKIYQVKITNTADVESLGLSKTFIVTGKSAAPYVLVPLILAGGLGAYFFLNKPGPVQPTSEQLPAPPNPN